MEEFKMQLLAVINNLSDTQLKQELAEKVNSSDITEALIIEIGHAVRQTVTDVEDQMVKELDQAETQIQQVFKDYQKTIKGIASERDQKHLEAIRKKLQ